MKNFGVVFSRRAEADLDRIEAFIAVDNLDAAAQVRKEIVAQAIRLGENPEIGWPIKNPKRQHRTVRLWPVTVFPVSDSLPARTPNCADRFNP